MKLTWHGGSEGDELHLSIEWFDHHNVPQHDQVTFRLVNDTPRRLEINREYEWKEGFKATSKVTLLPAIDLRAVVEQYGDHRSGCPGLHGPGQECTCGWRATAYALGIKERFVEPGV